MRQQETPFLPTDPLTPKWTGVRDSYHSLFSANGFESELGIIGIW